MPAAQRKDRAGAWGLGSPSLPGLPAWSTHVTQESGTLVPWGLMGTAGLLPAGHKFFQFMLR